MNYYERHIGDYLKNTAHLSLLEHGIYTRLLDVYYTRECGIEDADAARLVGARSKEEKQAMARVLREFFALEAGVWTQARCEREIARYNDKCEKARANIKKRWSSRSTDDLPPNNGGNTAVSDPNDIGNTPRARPQSPVTRQIHSVPDGTGAVAPPPTDRDAVFGNGIALLTAAGIADKNARSFLALQCKTHGEQAVRHALERCAAEAPIQPIPWLQAALKSTGPATSSKPDRIAQANADVVRKFAQRTAP